MVTNQNIYNLVTNTISQNSEKQMKFEHKMACLEKLQKNVNTTFLHSHDIVSPLKAPHSINSVLIKLEIACHELRIQHELYSNDYSFTDIA